MRPSKKSRKKAAPGEMDRSKNMAAIKGKGTRMEREMGRLLWGLGLRYRKNDPGIPGKPDFSFRGKRLAVFMDSDFWHGRVWRETGKIPKGNRDFWVKKLSRNIARDMEVDLHLREMGWVVVRIWEKDFWRHPAGYAEVVREVWKGLEGRSSPQKRGN